MTSLTEPAADYRSIWVYLYKTAHTVGWVDAAGHRTRYLEAGNRDNPTVVLLHGTLGSIENFCANISALAERFHVIAIDLVGCGWSDRPRERMSIRVWVDQLIGVLDSFGIDRAAVVGVSLGSFIGARAALERPDRVAGLIMVAPAGIVLDPEVSKSFVSAMVKRRTDAVDATSWETVRTIFKKLLLREDDIIDDLVAVRKDIYEDPSFKESMPLTIGGFSDEALTRDQWRSVDVPLLVVAAVDAPNIFLDNAYAIGELAPNAEVFELPGCDHWGQFEQPSMFNQRAIEFITGSVFAAK